MTPNDITRMRDDWLGRKVAQGHPITRERFARLVPHHLCEDTEPRADIIAIRDRARVRAQAHIAAHYAGQRNGAPA